MDPFLIPQVIDLAGENPAKTYRQPLAAGDSAAHRWEVRVVRGGQAADLTGCTACVLARREGEDSSPTVRQRAEIAGNVASAEFIPEVYALGGRILAMMVISGSDGRVITAAVLRLQGKTYTTDTICDPEGTIPSLEALLSRYEDMVAATGESRAATQAAQQATEETRAALTDAQAALATAQQAVTDAQGALGTAQTAADTANAAAVKIDDMTVSATPLSAGTASAALTLVDGHYHLTLGLPKGDTGATPQISVQVTTGAAGSEASVSVSGTAEEPVIHLTIPRGDTGAIENMTINGKPVESGNITLTPEDLGAATAESVSQLKNDKLDKTATAADASKLGGVAARDYALKTDTAPDSSKLGGKAPEYYTENKSYVCKGMIFNALNSTIEGIGTCTIISRPNGLAELHFAVTISNAPASSEVNVFSYGLNRDILREKGAPNITPLSGGIAEYIKNGQLDADILGYGGTFEAESQFWKPSRVYNVTGSVGGWPTSKFAVGMVITGMCFGTYKR